MSTRRALLYSFMDRYSGLVLAVVSSMIIARLLRPEELGVFSVAMAMLAFASTVRDMGAGQYVVQAREITHDVLRAVWTIQFSVGTGLALLVAGFAYPIAAFYDEPQLAPIMGVMALTYLSTPIGSITYALLMRDMLFRHVAVIRFSSALVASVVSVFLAWKDWGPISLAWGTLAGSLTTAVMSLRYRRPDQPWDLSFRGVKDILGFGSRMTGTSMANTLVQGMPDFALGKLQGMTAAGLYSRSNGMVAMFNRLLLDAIWGVAVAHFAAGRRADADPVPDFYRAVACLLTLNLVFAAVLMAFAHPLTRLLYGDQWDGSVELTRWLAAAAVFVAAQPVCSAMLTGFGRTDILLKTTLITGLINVVAAIIGASYGLTELGTCLLLAQLMSGAIWLRATRMVCAYQPCILYSTIYSATLTAIYAASPIPVILWVFGPTPDNPIATLAISSFAILISLIAAIVGTSHPLGIELKRIINLN